MTGNLESEDDILMPRIAWLFLELSPTQAVWWLSVTSLVTLET